MPRNGTPWHDAPDGEYLVFNDVSERAWKGEMTYQAIHAEIETLLPELADKPHQLLDGLREYYHGTRNEIVRAKGGEGWPVGKGEYEAARRVSREFRGGWQQRLEGESLLVMLMVLGFRRRGSHSVDWSMVGRDFAGRVKELFDQGVLRWRLTFDRQAVG